MAGRPRKHSTQDKSHKTKAEIAQRQDEEQKAGSDTFKHLGTKPPKTLVDAVAKNEYRRIVPLLNDLDATALDQTMVVSYCNSYSFYLQAMEDVKKNGLVIDGKKNPAYNIYKEMQKEIRASAGQLGMTIDSRMKLVRVDNTEDDADPYADLGGIQ